MSETAQAATARLEGTAPFAAVLDQVAALVDEARIEFTPAGIHVRAVDPANVGGVDVTLDADAFDSYETDGVTMGCNLKLLVNVLDDEPQEERGILAERSKPRGEDTIEFDEDAEELRIDTNASTFRIATMDPDHIREPANLTDASVPWTVTLTLPAMAFGRTVEDADVVSSHVTYGWNDDASEFYATAEGDVHAYEYRTEVVDVEADGDARSKYSLDYLRQRAPVLPGNGTVEVRLGEQCPTAVDYEIADGDGHVEYWLAPRIQCDDL